MNHREKLIDNVLVLHFEGDLIGENNGPQIMEKAHDYVLKGIIHCAIDISQVRYVNSSGLGVFISLLTKFRNEGGEVVLVNPSERAKQTLLITKLTSIFTIVETEEEALAVLKPSA